MNNLLNNMTRNVKTATLYGMHNDGVMTFDKDMMSTPVRTSFAGGLYDVSDDLAAKGIDPTAYPTLGSMPTDKILTYVSLVLSVLPD